MTQEAPPRETGVADLVLRDNNATELVTLTPSQAGQLLGQHRWARQRAILRSALTRLRRAMTQGEMVQSVIQLGHLPDGSVHVIDGQHRLMAQVEVGIDLEYILWHRYFATEEEMAAVYSQIDTNGVRGLNVAYQAHGLDERMGLTRRQVQDLGASTRMIEYGWASHAAYVASPRTPNEQVAMMEEWDDTMRLVVDTVRATTKWSRGLYISPILSVILATTRYQPARATTFWKRLADREGLYVGDPAFALMGYIESRRGARTPSHEIARGCSMAWNAEYSERPLRQVRVMDRNAPMRLLGTPFLGS